MGLVAKNRGGKQKSGYGKEYLIQIENFSFKPKTRCFVFELAEPKNLSVSTRNEPPRPQIGVRGKQNF